jgi:hypothetical protein
MLLLCDDQSIQLYGFIGINQIDERAGDSAQTCHRVVKFGLNTRKGAQQGFASALDYGGEQVLFASEMIVKRGFGNRRRHSDGFHADAAVTVSNEGERRCFEYGLSFGIVRVVHRIVE